MFRYVCLRWNPAAPADARAAQPLCEALAARPGWRQAWARSDARLFTFERDAGPNGVVLLPRGQGAIVGQLFRRLPADSSACATLTALDDDEADAILHTRQRLVERCWGRYVAFLAEPGGGLGIVRDPSGALPCLLWRRPGIDLCGSWLEDLLGLVPDAQPRPDREGVRSFLLLGLHGGTRTAVTGVEQVLPGEQRTVGGDAMTSALLWNPVAIARAPSGLAGAAAAVALRAEVRRCARQWAAGHERLVLRLSGGLDSSILASCLTPALTPADVLCLNYRSTDPGADERHYASLAARAAGRPLRSLESERGFRLERLLALPRTASPRAYVGAMGTAFLDAQVAAEHRATAMFTGVGGDALFFESQRWWPAADHLYLRGFDRRLFGVALEAAQLGGVSVWRALALALRERFRPSDHRIDPGRSYTLLTPQALDDLGPVDAFRHPLLRGRTGLPIGKFHQVQQLMVPMSCYDTLAFDTAPEPVYPLLSQPLVELVLQLPTPVLTEGGRSRALARRAFAAELPPEIARRRTKGITNLSSRQVLQDNLGFVRDLLLDGELVRLGLLDRRRCERALAAGPTPVATHGVEIHSLIAVEAWLRRWGP